MTQHGTHLTGRFCNTHKAFSRLMQFHFHIYDPRNKTPEMSRSTNIISADVLHVLLQQCPTIILV